MKFLCDRCKTRYSIGDDRVRGKILKIRCKNCANVITVREGMPEPDAVPVSTGARRTKSTTEAPVETSSTANGAKPGALGAAFANAMTKPAPAALEEEWYVSIDGDQSGPFSLGEAQRWVSSKPFDAELHCWSEGFDDWLPVDKVSHFRGLRKKAIATPPPVAAPPPIPRLGTSGGGGTGPARAIAPRIPEEEHTPKPLFAATMASLEKSASAAHVGAGAGGAAAVNSLRVEARAPLKPLNGNGSHAPKPAPSVGNGRMRTSPGVATAKLGIEEPATVSEAQPFTEDQPTLKPESASTPVATKPMPHLKSVGAAAQTGPNDAFLDQLAKERNERKAAKGPEIEKPKLSLAALEAATTPNEHEAPTVRAGDMAPAAPVVPAGPMFPDARAIEGDDDMEIGEVSRVVNLADLARPQAKRAPTISPANRTGAVGRVTGPVPKVNATGAVPRINATGAVPRINATGGVALIDAVDALPSGNTLAPPPAEPEKHSRRGLYILLAGAAVLLGAAAVILMLKLNTTEDVTGLGGEYEINTERPDVVVRRPGDPTPGSGAIDPPVNPFIPKPPVKPPVRPPTQGSNKLPDQPPAGNSLSSNDIEAMARSTSALTTACFRRASKGVDDIILSDVKKIRVAFKVNPDGSVAANSVDLSEKRSATLTSCLQRMVAGWKFRPNAGGDFGFVLAKPD